MIAGFNGVEVRVVSTSLVGEGLRETRFVGRCPAFDVFGKFAGAKIRWKSCDAQRAGKVTAAAEGRKHAAVVFCRLVRATTLGACGAKSGLGAWGSFFAFLARCDALAVPNLVVLALCTKCARRSDLPLPWAATIEGQVTCSHQTHPRRRCASSWLHGGEVQCAVRSDLGGAHC